MHIQILRLAIVAAAFCFAVPVMGQHTGFVNSGYGLSGAENCGRKITQQYAESLWAGYCTEGCAYQGGGDTGCGLFGKCGGCGRNGGSCGCYSGCFGYPAGGGGCGGKLGSLHGGGCGGKLGGGCKLKGFHGGGGCGCGGKLGALHGGGGCGGKLGGGCGCKLKGLHGGDGCSDCGGGGCGGKLGALHGGGGCGCKLGSRHGGGGGFGKLKGLHGGCCKLFGGCKKFGQSAQQCGTSGAYFEEAVGYEYGTSGIQSCVSCNSCGSFDSSAAPYAQPMAAPYAQPQSVLGAPAMAEPVVGAIETLN